MEQTILEAVMTQLATITVANGFLTDIGENVTYYDPYLAEYKGPAKVTIRDADDESEKVNQNHQILLQLEVEAIAYTTEATKLADSCNLIKDLVQCLVCDRNWLPDGVIAVRRRGRNKLIEGGSKQVIAITLNIEIEYRELIE
jgi:hypothetical protein